MMIQKLQNKSWLKAHYHTRNRSMQDIADELGTNKQRVRRALMRLGIPPKSKSEAQKAALKSGRAEHPTEGKERSEEVKLRIAESVANDWANADEETLKARSDKAKAQWAAMSPEEQDAFIRMGLDAVRTAAKEGSKLEKHLRTALTNAGYDVEYHVVGLVPNQNLEVDLFLPGLSVAIEVDGPSHSLPIWGAENLAKNIQSDLQKTGLLLTQKLVVIRVKHITSNVSQLLKQQVWTAVQAEIAKVEKRFPPQNKRYIEIEV
jgi:very-short-patch-repair endonuclease